MTIAIGAVRTWTKAPEAPEPATMVTESVIAILLLPSISSSFFNSAGI
jgi:hypothetical protein